jgi:hypothetical protein
MATKDVSEADIFFPLPGPCPRSIVESSWPNFQRARIRSISASGSVPMRWAAVAIVV